MAVPPIETGRACSAPVDSTVLAATVADGTLAYSSASDVAILPGPAYAIADRMNLRFAVFRPDGRVEHVGGEGDGPGEMKSFAWGRTGKTEGTLMAYDPAKRTVNVYDRDGRFGVAVDVRAPRRWVHSLLGPDSRGQFIVVPIDQRDGRKHAQGVILRDTIPYLLLRPGVENADTIGWFLGDEVYSMTLAEAGQTMIYNAAPPLGRRTLYAVASDNLWIMDNLTGSVRILDLVAGEWREQTLKGLSAPRLTWSQKQVYKERYLRPTREFFRPFLEEAWKTVGAGRKPPVVGDMVGAHSSDAILVREFMGELSHESRWHVLRGSGQYVGCIIVPTSRRVVNAHGHEVATIGTSNLDEEIVYLYRYRHALAD